MLSSSLPGLADERLAARVFLGARPLADEQPVGLLVADAEHGVGARHAERQAVQRATAALSAGQSMRAMRAARSSRSREPATPGGTGGWPARSASVGARRSLATAVVPRGHAPAPQPPRGASPISARIGRAGRGSQREAQDERVLAPALGRVVAAADADCSNPYAHRAPAPAGWTGAPRGRWTSAPKRARRASARAACVAVAAPLARLRRWSG